MSHCHHQKINIVIQGKYIIPESCLEKHFSHSHGHGGQNINKVATKVQLKVYIDHLTLPEEIKQKLDHKFPQGHIEVSAQETKHQHKNFELALKKLQKTIEQSL